MVLGEKYYIISPKAEANNKISKFNPNPQATKVYYDGISLDKAVSALVAYTGRKPKIMSNNDWVDNDFEEFAAPVLKKHNITFAPTHYYSEYMTERIMETNANKIIAIFEALNEMNPSNGYT